MTSEKTKALFKENINIQEAFCVETLMRRLKISRPTATNLISALFNMRTKPIMPIMRLGDKQKWYIRKH